MTIVNYSEWEQYGFHIQLHLRFDLNNKSFVQCSLLKILIEQIEIQHIIPVTEKNMFDMFDVFYLTEIYTC